MKLDALNPTITEPLAVGLDLVVTAAALNAAGQATANVQCWNGSIQHEDAFALYLDLPRHRFAKAVSAKIPSVDAKAVEDLLLKLSIGLPQELAARAAAATTNTVAPTGPDPATLWQACEAIAQDPQLLEKVAAALGAQGLIGEGRNALLLYLAMTSRLQDCPVSCIVKGPSSGGKSYLIKMAISLLPASAYVDFTSISAKFLAYSEIDLRHRIVVLYEAGGIADGVGAYIMRSLISEGRLRIGTVEKEGDGDNSRQVAREIVTEGPTMLVTSTTRAGLDGELETRALTLTVVDTPTQTRAIVRGIAKAQAGQSPATVDLAPFHALQEWLAVAGERRVRVPWAPVLAEAVPVAAIRMRRDISKLFELIAACALLHQAQRPRDSDGVIVATLDDYALVRDLLAESFAAAQQEGLTATQREAVKAVETLCADLQVAAMGVSLRQVAEALKLDKSAVSRRLANPIAAGYVRDLTVDDKGKHRNGKPAAYIPGDPLPPPEDALPTVDKLRDLIVDAENLKDVTL